MLEPDTLCSLACVSRTLELNVKAFALDSETFDGVISKFGIRGMKKITLDCLHLSDSSIKTLLLLLVPDLEELHLLNCCSLSYKLLATIGTLCPNLRVLTLEISVSVHEFGLFHLNLQGSLLNCQHLESLGIKVRREELNHDPLFLLSGIYEELPDSVKVLKLQPTTALDTVIFWKTFTDEKLSISVALMTTRQNLTHISLVVDIICDILLKTIAHGLPLLVELDFKDRVTDDLSDDLYNLGIQSLIDCKHLISLSLIRSRQLFAPVFEIVNDTGMLLLSEGCKQLESVRFGGFSKVSDAGFTSILNSCVNLKNFEIQNVPSLTDFKFQDFVRVSRSLVEVNLVKCWSITSQAVSALATCSSLKVLDLHGCVNVQDSGLDSVSRLTLLTTLNLGGTDVTDAGMGILGKGNAPISCLSLRGCMSVSDEGIVSLLGSEGKIRKTLTSLDLGNTRQLTDKAITTVVDACAGLTELSIRGCNRVTNESVKGLELKGRVQRLDLSSCFALSDECLQFLKKPLFRGLRWIGIGGTRFARVKAGFDEIRRERKWLTIYKNGCEVGSHDEWQDHEF